MLIQKTDAGAQFIPVATNCGLSATVSGNDVTELKCDIARRMSCSYPAATPD
jgi:hypothetical protein